MNAQNRPVLHLASRSPRRLDLLQSVGLNPLKIDFPAVEEKNPVKISDFNDLSFLSDNAGQKLRAAWNALPTQNRTLGTLIAADTTVLFEKFVFGKPATPDEARRMLASLSGKTHRVATAVHIASFAAEKLTQESQLTVITKVTFCPLSTELIDWYVKTEEPMDKAGGYGIQAIGGSLVERIEGSYSNVVGLPLFETLSSLEKCSGRPWHEWC